MKMDIVRGLLKWREKMDEKDVEHFVFLLREIAKLLDDISKKLDRIERNMPIRPSIGCGIG